MKKLLIIIMLGLFVYGCGATAQQSEYWKHDSHFKNWDHLKFSLWGYKNPTAETQKESQEQGWWGTEVPYIPAE
jgi:hypothetical protein